jgi:hypothetical protein
MPVKRRLAKIRQFQITPEVRQKYAEAGKLNEIYRNCVHGKTCRAPEFNTRCRECERYFELLHEVDDALGLKPWQCLPIGYDSLEEALEDLHDPIG